jgi:hypothetical protein
MDSYVGEVTFQATPVVPAMRGGERRGGEEKPGVSRVSPALHLASSARSQADAKYRTCQECLMQVGLFPRPFIIPSPCQSVCSHHFYPRPQESLPPPHGHLPHALPTDTHPYNHTLHRHIPLQPHPPHAHTPTTPHRGTHIPATTSHTHAPPTTTPHTHAQTPQYIPHKNPSTETYSHRHMHKYASDMCAHMT